ncbi:MAG: hypothetical protein ACRDPC_24775, partial [Solirubrobacteraceae bacterium]
GGTTAGGGGGDGAGGAAPNGGGDGSGGVRGESATRLPSVPGAPDDPGLLLAFLVVLLAGAAGFATPYVRDALRRN